MFSVSIGIIGKIMKIWVKVKNSSKRFCQPTVGRLSAVGRSTVSRLSAVNRPTVGRLSAVSRLTVGRQTLQFACAAVLTLVKFFFCFFVLS